MSTFTYRLQNASEETTGSLKRVLDRLKEEKSIEGWQINGNAGQMLQVNSIKLSSEELKHLIREEGIDADFAPAPEVKQ